MISGRVSLFGSETRNAPSNRINIGASSRVGRQQRARGVRMKTGRFSTPRMPDYELDARVYKHIHTQMPVARKPMPPSSPPCFYHGDSRQMRLCARGIFAASSRRPPPEDFRINQSFVSRAPPVLAP